MTNLDYLKILVEDIHSAVVATIGADGHPQTRTIDMMLWDEKGVYFLTVKGKDFYTQLMEQRYLFTQKSTRQKNLGKDYEWIKAGNGAEHKKYIFTVT